MMAGELSIESKDGTVRGVSSQYGLLKRLYCPASLVSRLLSLSLSLSLFLSLSLPTSLSLSQCCSLGPRKLVSITGGESHSSKSVSASRVLLLLTLLETSSWWYRNESEFKCLQRFKLIRNSRHIFEYYYLRLEGNNVPHHIKWHSFYYNPKSICSVPY